MASVQNTHIIDLEQLDENIRPFPATATKIVSLCNDNETKSSEITELIECEPAIAIKLLSVANSPIYAATREITSINHAVVVLGYRTVTQLALSVAAGPLFSSGNKALVDQRIQLFYQSLGVATVSRILAEELDLADPSEAFLSGMMLDVGKLFFFDVAPDPYLSILQQHPHGNTVDTETEVFGTNHPLIGNVCGRKWGLPHQINNAIKDHHLSLDQVNDKLTQAILCGSYFAQKWELGFTPGQFAACPNMDEEFSTAVSDELAETAKVQFTAFKSMFTFD